MSIGTVILVVYLIGALTAWVLVGYRFFRDELDVTYRVDWEEIIMSAMMAFGVGLIAGIFWPIALPIFLMVEHGPDPQQVANRVTGKDKPERTSWLRRADRWLAKLVKR